MAHAPPRSLHGRSRYSARGAEGATYHVLMADRPELGPRKSAVLRAVVEEYVRDRALRGEIATGLLYVNESAPDMHELNHTPAQGLNKIPLSQLCPGSAALAELQDDFR